MAFQGPTPEFMDALRMKYALMQQEANSKTALQGAQTDLTRTQNELAPGIAGAQITKMGAEAGLDIARTGLTNEGITDAKMARASAYNPINGILQSAALKQLFPNLYGDAAAGLGNSQSAAPTASLPSFGGPGIFTLPGGSSTSESRSAAGASRLQKQPDYWGLR